MQKGKNKLYLSHHTANSPLPVYPGSSSCVYIQRRLEFLQLLATLFVVARAIHTTFPGHEHLVPAAAVHVEVVVETSREQTAALLTWNYLPCLTEGQANARATDDAAPAKATSCKI